MSARNFWPWLAVAAAVHVVALLLAIPRSAPRPEVRVRVATAVSFQASPAVSKRAVSRPQPVAAPAVSSSAASPESVVTAPQTAASDTGEDAPASGTPDLRADPDPVGTYLERLREAVSVHKSYPYAARTRRQEGTVLLAFRLDGAGGLTDEPQVVRSSGYPRLDAAAVEAVKVASPFVPPPEAARPWEFRLPVEFVVR